MSNNLIAVIESEARDCDGIYNSSGEYRQTKTEDDYDFYNRVLSEIVSPYAENGSLTIAQRDGFPEFVWHEETEEGYERKVVRFYPQSDEFYSCMQCVTPMLSGDIDCPECGTPREF